MRYVCDAPGGLIWFSMETQIEADAESELMRHAVAKHFKLGIDAARDSYRPRAGLASFERNIGLKDHIERTAPVFFTLRDAEGKALATAMLSRDGGAALGHRSVIVGPDNSDPYPEHATAIATLGAYHGISLPRERCYPYS